MIHAMLVLVKDLKLGACDAMDPGEHGMPITQSH